MVETFSTLSVARCSNQDQLAVAVKSRVSGVQAGSNTSTVALRVVGGDEKGTHCVGYNWATLFLGNVNKGTWPPICDSKIL
jgi:hypothetical protein